MCLIHIDCATIKFRIFNIVVQLQVKMQQAEQLSSQLFERLSVQHAGDNDWVYRAQQVLRDAPINVPKQARLATKRLSTMLAGLVILMGVTSTTIDTEIVNPSNPQVIATSSTPITAQASLKMSLNLSDVKH